MQAVILAAGRGTRMRPLSSVTAKPMLPVGDRPLVAHVADAAVDAGASELVFVVGYKAEHVRAYFDDEYRGTPVTYAHQESPSGTADAVRAASDRIEGRFAVLNGDNVFDPESIADLFARDAAIAAHRVENPSEYGVLSTADGYATAVVEKPDDPPSNLVNAGAYVFPEWVASALDVPESERGEHELTDVLARLLDSRDVAVVETAYWLDVARPTDLVRANELVLAETATTTGSVLRGLTNGGSSVAVDDTASVADGATLRGPVLVGRNARVADGAVLDGPTVVGADASVGRNAELSKTVLLPGATVGPDVRLHDVVLGPYCDISEDAHVAGVENESENGTAAVVTAEGVGTDGLPY